MILQHLRTWSKHALYVSIILRVLRTFVRYVHLLKSYHVLYTLHLDMDTHIEWSWTLKLLNSSPGVGPHCSPSLESSTFDNTETTIKWWICSSGHSCSRWSGGGQAMYYINIMCKQAAPCNSILGLHFNIHSPKYTFELKGSSVIWMLVAPAGMVNPSW